MMRFRVGRRTFLAAALAAPVAAGAQPASKTVPRIGYLTGGTLSANSGRIEAFRRGLRDLGYVEGQNLVIEWRWAEGNYERFPKLVGELVAQKVELIVTAGTPAAQAVERTAPAMPLVMVAVGDPVGTGLVESLAVPGGHATGLTSIAPDLEGKRLQLLAEVVPKLAHVALLMNPGNPFHVTAEREAQAAAKTLGVRLDDVGVRETAELGGAFDTIARNRPDAFIMLADRVFLHDRRQIADFAAQNRLPAVYAYRELVEAGGLMAFGPNYAEMHRRAAAYVDRILRGAKPGDLPIELPTKFELIVNVKAAKALGLSIPQSVLVRADVIIR